ncbi:MAG: adenine phosphoribosyltransferase [Fimbriimonadaceae bacterium]|nr:adenine phosphoribosyltransferase [Fimbriimonadaceae bacterium]
MPELLAASLIRDIPDFPKPGILFKDISPVLQSPAAVQECVGLLSEDAREHGAEVIVGIESRGFIFGMPMALQLGLPFAMTRKKGKLPYETVDVEYSLEYGAAVLEMHVDAVNPGQRAYIVDDLLATGGTAAASALLVEKLSAQVCGFGFAVELGFLNGRSRLNERPVRSLITF